MSRTRTFIAWGIASLLGWLVVVIGVGLADTVSRHHAPPAHAEPRFVFPSISEQRDSIVAQEARRAGVPVTLAVGVSHIEDWSGDSAAVSARGAIGLMQVNPRWWAHAFIEECGDAPLINRRRNACVGCHVLLYYHGRVHTWAKAARAFHGSQSDIRYTDDLLNYAVL